MASQPAALPLEVNHLTLTLLYAINVNCVQRAGGSTAVTRCSSIWLGGLPLLAIGSANMRTSSGSICWLDCLPAEPSFD